MIYNNINVYNSDLMKFEKNSVLIEDGKFKQIRDEAFEDGIDYSDKYMLPAFINTHTHLAMSLLRNYADDLNLQDWLEQEIWPIEDLMTDDDMYWGSLLSMAEMISGGTTCFNDMYTAQHLTIQAAQEIGMRGVICQGLTNFSDEVYKVQLEKTDRILGIDLPDYLKIGIAPHAIYTLNDEGYKYSYDLAKSNSAIYHTHLSETVKENEDCINAHGKTPTKYLYDLGVIDNKTVLAHCVHLTDEDMEIIAKTNASISINISSNLKLASGIPDIKRMLEHGINVSIGTDGASSNNNQSMLTEMQLISKIIKGVNQDPCILKAGEVINMATKNGAKALHFDNLGEIKEGFIADYSIFDLSGIHNSPLNNPVSAIIYSAKDSDVVEVGMNGNVVYQNGEFKNINISNVLDNCKHIIKRLKNELSDNK